MLWWRQQSPEGGPWSPIRVNLAIGYIKVDGGVDFTRKESLIPSIKDLDNILTVPNCNFQK